MNENTAIWTDDTDTSTTSTSAASTAPAYRPPQFDANTPLTAHQKKLITIHHLHRHYELEVMNTVVYLEITIRRERDQLGVKFVERELQFMQGELVRHREGRKRVEGKTRREKERLRRVVERMKGEEREKDVARRQLKEMEKAVGERRERAQCLR